MPARHDRARPIIAIASPTVNLASAAEPVATPAPQGAESKTAAAPQTAAPQVDPHAERILRSACAELADAKTFTFHAEVTFEQVLPQTPVKIQFAGITDYAVRKPGATADAINCAAAQVRRNRHQ